MFPPVRLFVTAAHNLGLCVDLTTAASRGVPNLPVAAASAAYNVSTISALTFFPVLSPPETGFCWAAMLQTRLVVAPVRCRSQLRWMAAPLRSPAMTPPHTLTHT